MEAVFTIRGRWHKDKCLPDLNDYISKAVSVNPTYAIQKKTFAKFKGDCEAIVIDAFRQQVRGFKPSGKVRIDIVFAEPFQTKSPRDEDNVIGFGRKVIHDALVSIGVLVDDKPKYVQCGYSQVIYTDEPFIEIHIVEIEVATP